MCIHNYKLGQVQRHIGTPTSYQNTYLPIIYSHYFFFFDRKRILLKKRKRGKYKEMRTRSYPEQNET